MYSALLFMCLRVILSIFAFYRMKKDATDVILCLFTSKNRAGSGLGHALGRASGLKSGLIVL